MERAVLSQHSSGSLSGHTAVLPQSMGELFRGPETYTWLSTLPTWTGTGSPVGFWELGKHFTGSEKATAEN